MKQKGLVGDLVEKLRTDYPTTPRSLLRSHIRLELEHRKIPFTDAVEKQLDRALDKTFFFEEEQVKKVKKGKQKLVSQKMVDRYWRSVEEVKLAHDASEAYERALYAWHNASSPYKEDILDPSFKTAENALEQIRKFPDLFVRGVKEIAFKKKAMHRLLEKLTEAGHAMDRDLVE